MTLRKKCVLMVSVIEMKKEIGKRIREYRKLAKLSQIELAEKLSVTNRAVSNWESGANGVDVELIPAICEALHISPNDLMDTPSVQALSPAALKFARAFDELDPLDQQLVESVVRIASKRPKSMRVVPVIGTVDATGEIETRYAARKKVLELENVVNEEGAKL